VLILNPSKAARNTAKARYYSTTKKTEQEERASVRIMIKQRTTFRVNLLEMGIPSPPAPLPRWGEGAAARDCSVSNQLAECPYNSQLSLDAKLPAARNEKALVG